jgi:RES domain
MAVSPGLGITVAAGVSYYRITSLGFRTASSKHHAKVVNGEGAVRSRHGARYNYPGARSVYLTEDPPTCLAEKLFYFQREVLTALDGLHLPHSPGIPPFSQKFVLWDVVLRNPVTNVFDLSIANAPAAGVFPCLMLNPSQDYHHLKDRRADMQASGYRGLRAPATRVVGGGNMVVLFDDQSKNLHAITPYEVEFRLITPGAPPRAPFASHVTNLLDYLAGELRVVAPLAPAALPPALLPFAAWTVVPFNH